MKPGDAEYGLICPFLTDDPMYARGVELGMLFMDMRRKRKIRNYFTRWNQEQILLLANRLKWVVKKMENWGEEWFLLVMERRKGGT